MTSDNMHWYAVYTKPRWEKKVFELMRHKGFESYCPLNKVKKKWSDRFKTVEEPLFKSYVFVRVLEADLPKVRFVDGIVNFVYWLGKPARIPDSDIINLKMFLNEYSDIKVETRDSFEPGDLIRIKSGLLMHQKGRVVEDRNKSIILEIKSLGFYLVATVNKDQVEILPKNESLHD
ncbi:UpxY family transcription antiterminator [Flavihumibacter sp. ZG627]|uniref:UpxY family transcription antiterminator n=1 Tax=Flavihumibacter sp. ZG627 TaxID=1463156 RepID=UPI00057E9252|nr:UpxY family transcription antiterminator [Flavihumibacter sp. ZG627]KIC92257.1 hypothetical protein HY58_01505 [Flavihumibacter sp. ZG627]